MSCWKCEKELPEGQVECEPDCGAQPLNGLPNTNLTDVPVVCITITLNPDRVHADKESYFKAVVEFNKMVTKAFAASGISEFAKE
jgi:hypothetical protein